MNRKTLITILGVVAVIFIGTGVYSVSAKKARHAKVVAPVTSESTALKTYTNSMYGFSFKYPSGVSLGLRDERHDKIFYTTSLKTNDGYPFQILAGQKNNLSYFLNPPETPALAVEKSTIKNGSETWNVINQVCIPQEGRGTACSELTYYFVKGDYAYAMLCSGCDEAIFGDDGKQKLSLFNQIFATFKFTKSDSTAGWKTYTNNNYGFQISYPQNDSLQESMEDNRQESGNTVSYHSGKIIDIRFETDIKYFGTSAQITADNVSVNDCYQNQSGQNSNQTVTKNGIVFHNLGNGFGESVGPHETTETEEYAVIHNNICYQISLRMTHDRGDSSYADPLNRANRENYFDKIFSTFQFTNFAPLLSPPSYSLTVNSVSPTSAHFGDAVQISGSGFTTSPAAEYPRKGADLGQLYVYIGKQPSRVDIGVTGVLWTGYATNDTTISFNLPSQACQRGGAPGVPCIEYKALTPGNYFLEVNVQNYLRSTPLSFEIK